MYSSKLKKKKKKIYVVQFWNLHHLTRLKNFDIFYKNYLNFSRFHKVVISVYEKNYIIKTKSRKNVSTNWVCVFWHILSCKKSRRSETSPQDLDRNVMKCPICTWWQSTVLSLKDSQLSCHCEGFFQWRSIFYYSEGLFPYQKFFSIAKHFFKFSHDTR